MSGGTGAANARGSTRSRSRPRMGSHSSARTPRPSATRRWCPRCRRALDALNVAAALRFEGFRANLSPLDPRVQAARPAPGQRGDRTAAADLARRQRAVADRARPGACRIRCRFAASRRCMARRCRRCASRATTSSSSSNSAADSPLVLPDHDGDAVQRQLPHSGARARLRRARLALAQCAALRVAALPAACTSTAFTGLPLQLTSARSRAFGLCDDPEDADCARQRDPPSGQPGVAGLSCRFPRAVEDHAPMAVNVVAPRPRRSSSRCVHESRRSSFSRPRRPSTCAPAEVGALGRGARAALRSRARAVPMLDEDRPLGPDVERVAAQRSTTLPLRRHCCAMTWLLNNWDQVLTGSTSTSSSPPRRSLIAFAISLVVGILGRAKRSRVPLVDRALRLPLHDPDACVPRAADPARRPRPKANAIICMVAFSLMILIRNVATGIREVPPDVVDAARGMGMTRAECCARRAPARAAGDRRGLAHRGGHGDQRRGRRRVRQRRRARHADLQRHQQRSRAEDLGGRPHRLRARGGRPTFRLARLERTLRRGVPHDARRRGLGNSSCSIPVASSPRWYATSMLSASGACDCHRDRRSRGHRIRREAAHRCWPRSTIAEHRAHAPVACRARAGRCRILGTGFAPSLFALTLLALPPILINTCTAMRQVDPDVVDAARGMGMSRGEIVRGVEIPIATAGDLRGHSHGGRAGRVAAPSSPRTSAAADWATSSPPASR